MPEFTVGVEETAESSSSIVDEAIEGFINDLKNDKEKQVQIAQALHENYGIDPQLLSTFVDVPAETANEPAESPTPVPEETAENRSENNTQVKTVTESPSPDEVIGFIDELTDYLDEDTTLAELREYAENNKDLLATAIELHF
jgi:hypothetical protein